MHSISSNKRLQQAPMLYDLALLKESCLKEGSPYLKVREIIHMKFQNFVKFSFQITINNYHYDKCFRTTRYFYCYIVFILVAYEFQFNYG